MRTALLLLAMLAAPAFAGAIYKWVDEKGVTHYSDQPGPGATKMDVSTGSNRWESSAPRAPSVTSSNAPVPPSGPPYLQLDVATPAEGESFINTGGKVSVEIRTNPAVSGDHSLVLLLDGAAVTDYPRSSLSHELNNVPRGQHTLVVAVEDGRRQRLQESAPRTFYVRQESIAQPPVGPSLRPPPKPRN